MKSSLDRFIDTCRELWDGTVTARFYPYNELKHTWKRRGNVLDFKISDYVDGAPSTVMKSLARYLIYRALDRPCPAELAEEYLDYSRSKGLWDRNRDTYLSRARNLRLGPEGRAFDLRGVYDYVNSFYFSGSVPCPILAWTTESPTQRLGYYFEPLNLLVANSVMDSERVPRYVLEFVVYHELLHHVDADSFRRRRRVHHTRSFREQEKRFTHFKESQAWLRRLARAK